MGNLFLAAATPKRRHARGFYATYTNAGFILHYDVYTRKKEKEKVW